MRSIVLAVSFVLFASVAMANPIANGNRVSDKELSVVKGTNGAHGDPYWAGVYAPSPYWQSNGCGVACKPADWGQYRSSH
jgi:hypothetical protein